MQNASTNIYLIKFEHIHFFFVCVCVCVCVQIEIFTFNKHFNKENDCVQEPLKEMPNHWRSYFITFYIVNFLLLKTKT